MFIKILSIVLVWFLRALSSKVIRMFAVEVAPLVENFRDFGSARKKILRRSSLPSLKASDSIVSYKRSKFKTMLSS